jgi:hypothetical protein
MLWLMLGCAAEIDAPASRRAQPSVDAGADTGSGETPPADTAPPLEADTSADTGPALEPTVAIVSPSDGAVLENPVTFRVALADVAWAELEADGYSLGRIESEGESELTYTFSGTGYPRVITLTGYDPAGAQAARDEVSIEVQPDEVSLDVPYFYQYDNVYEPGSTCGITSAAMLVDTFEPGSVTPDSLYVTYGKAQGQSPDGLAALYKDEGLAADWTYTGTRAEIRAHLDAGRPVVVHGWWTSAGHVTVIVGYSDDAWIVNDPAGDWYTCYGCGEADHISYPLGGDWDEAMSVDGDVWYSTADHEPF